MKNKHIPPIIFFYKGIFPSYAYDSLKINRKNVSNKIILLCDISKIDKKRIEKNIILYDYNKFNEELKDIKFPNKKIKSFRSRFWIRTIERYLIINSFCKFYKINKFYHVELDNLINDLSMLHKRLDKYKNKIFFSVVGSLGFGSFVYINSLKVFENFCFFSKNTIKKIFKNDMQLLYLFSKKYKSQTKHLPTIENYFDNGKNNAVSPVEAGGIFDSLHIGSYLFGQDPRNHCYFISSLKKHYQTNNTYNILQKFKYNFTSKNYYATFKENHIKIFNIHVHSKLIKKIFFKNKYKQIIKKANLKLPTIIDYNILNILKLFFSDFRFSRFKKLLEQI